MQFSLSDILYALLLFLLFFISIFLFTSDRGKRISNILLGAFFLAIFLNLADSFLLLKQVYFAYPSWALWSSSMILLFGPLLYFYTASVIYKDFGFTGKKLFHFLPFVFFFIATEIAYLSAGHDKELEILKGIYYRKLPSSVYIFSVLFYLHFIVYLVMAYLSVKRHQKIAANVYSNAQKVTMSWLRLNIWFFLFIIVMGAVNSYLSFQSLSNAYFVVLGIMIFVLLLFIVFILFKALRNPGMFSVWEEKEIEEVMNVKYATSNVAVDEKKTILAKLQQHMAANKPYLEPDLTLDQLAAQLSVKPKLLSQVINEMAEQNFFEFINQYRIEEAKRLLTNPKDKKITVLEVLYEVGFNSKSSFNTLFKKETGLTPSEFKRKYME